MEVGTIEKPPACLGFIDAVMSNDVERRECSDKCRFTHLCVMALLEIKRQKQTQYIYGDRSRTIQTPWFDSGQNMK